VRVSLVQGMIVYDEFRRFAQGHADVLVVFSQLSNSIAHTFDQAALKHSKESYSEARPDASESRV
jgi:hypothetical protein